MHIISPLFLVAISAVSTAEVIAEVNVNKEFHDFPGVRFTSWNALPVEMKQYAQDLGYTDESWNNVGTADIEQYSWDEFGSNERNALGELGFTSSTWNCYMNHYNDYSWSDLIVQDMDQAARILGYTPESWTAGGGGTTLDWDEMDDGQQWAATDFCYFKDTWDEVPLNEMNHIPIVYPHFRYIPWEDLTPSEVSQAQTAGWEQESWDVTDKASLEFSAFSDLPEPQRVALLEMGFYEEQYDCYINHYHGYDWSELEEWGLAKFYEAFGFTEVLYSSGEPPVGYAQTHWDGLTEAQKTAAYEICWFKELWDEEPVAEWDSIEFPQFRFTKWDDLSSTRQKSAATVGWSRATWDVPGTADLERSIFDDLTPDQQMALRSIGFFNKDMYDCYVNHYNGLDWNQLADWNVLEYLMALGWSQGSWDGISDPPESEYIFWYELSDAQKSAATSLCYFEEIWDKSSLVEWEGVGWAEWRYWTWSGLSNNDRALLSSAGYNQDTWNNPGSAPFEKVSWDSLSWQQREALTEYGFYKSQWNCYMAHYDDYGWFELEMEEVEEQFMTLGWTKAKWETNDQPWASTAAWDELSEAERDAAWELCYVKETWDKIPLTEWDHNLSNPAGRRRSSNSDNGRPGFVIFLILLILGAFGGLLFFWKKHRTGEDTTFSQAEEPNMKTVNYDTDPNDSIESEVIIT